MDPKAREKLEEFMNEHLKQDLATYQRYIEYYNEEITEFIQLKNTVIALRENCPDGFKSLVHVGSTMYMKAKVDEFKKILVNVGKNIYVEFSIDEAIKFCDFKIKTLTKECDVVRDASITKRAEIKLALLCMGEGQGLNEQ